MERQGSYWEPSRCLQVGHLGAISRPPPKSMYTATLAVVLHVSLSAG
jgi:hypothetical protein